MQKHTHVLTESERFVTCLGSMDNEDQLVKTLVLLVQFIGPPMLSQVAVATLLKDAYKRDQMGVWV